MTLAKSELFNPAGSFTVRRNTNMELFVGTGGALKVAMGLVLLFKKTLTGPAVWVQRNVKRSLSGSWLLLPINLTVAFSLTVKSGPAFAIGARPAAPAVPML